jgi:hypothetical protein
MSSAGLGPEKDWAGEAGSICKFQNRPLVRENAAHQQTHNCLMINKKGENFVLGPR